MLTVEHVSYSYMRGTNLERAVLNDITFTVGNETVALVGESGSGKTTLLELIAGLNPLQSGNIHVDGSVAVSFQNPDHQLFEETVARDIAFGLHLMNAPNIDERVAEIMKQVGLPTELANVSPFKLSFGQRKLAALAGILVLNRKWLLLDEPTAGLDAAARKRVLKLIRRPAIVATHDLELAAHLDRIFTLSGGQLHENFSDKFNAPR